MVNDPPTSPEHEPIPEIVPAGADAQAAALDRVYRQAGDVYRFAGDIVDTICDPGNSAVWVPWFRCVAIEFLVVGIGRDDLADLLRQIATASARASGQPIPAHGCAFPGPYPRLMWHHFIHDTPPPPIQRGRRGQRGGKPVFAHNADWMRPEYDDTAWDILYEMALRCTPTGDLYELGLYPIPGVDPMIVSPADQMPDLATRQPNDVIEALFAPDHLVHDLPGDTRVPMGLGVALLTLRQLAYDFFYNGGPGLGTWVYTTITGIRTRRQLALNDSQCLVLFRLHPTSRADESAHAFFRFLPDHGVSWRA